MLSAKYLFVKGSVGLFRLEFDNSAKHEHIGAESNLSFLLKVVASGRSNREFHNSDILILEGKLISGDVFTHTE